MRECEEVRFSLGLQAGCGSADPRGSPQSLLWKVSLTKPVVSEPRELRQSWHRAWVPPRQWDAAPALRACISSGLWHGLQEAGLAHGAMSSPVLFLTKRLGLWSAAGQAVAMAATIVSRSLYAPR